MSIVPADKKLPSALLAIFLGQLGIHKLFYGATNAGLVMLFGSIVGWVLSPFTCGISALIPAIMSVVGVVEGIIYFTKSDGQFYSDYQILKKPWF